ncbi:hypothetical protein EXS54_00960 [Patescibacteria group bacterium]|nr:hypothetical protein [Patescibacteria group bacterium]
MGAFILGYCFIDAMASLYSGETNNNNPGTRFKRFVKEYFTQRIDTRYNAEHVYHDLRSGLVHSYAIGKHYEFTDKQHLGKQWSMYRRRTVLNLEDFIEHLEEAYWLFIQDIRENDDVFKKAKRRYRKYRLIVSR